MRTFRCNQGSVPVREIADKWFCEGSSCYKFVTETQVGYHEAANMCSEMGDGLVQIGTEREMSVLTYMKETLAQDGTRFMQPLYIGKLNLFAGLNSSPYVVC